jgi:transposase-like protein
MDGNWRAQLRAEGVERRPPPSRSAEPAPAASAEPSRRDAGGKPTTSAFPPLRVATAQPDRGYIEQPGEGIKPKPTPVMLPDSKLRRRIEVSPTPSTPTACIRPELNADYEPPGGEDELEELRAMGRELEAQNDEKLSPQPETQPSDQKLVRIERPGGASHMRRARRVWAWPDDKKEAIIRRALDSGMLNREVAAEFDVSPSTVSRLVRERLNEQHEEKNRMPGKRSEQSYHPPKEKLKAVAVLRAIQKRDGGERRGQIAEAARTAGVPRELLGNWAASGEYEPDAEPAPKPQESESNKTMMSRPEPPPVSQPMPPSAPVSYTQPVYHPAPPMPYPPQQPAAIAPTAPPPWWNQQQPAAPPPPSASPQMMGLEEYIKGIVAHELERQLPAAVQAALTKLWGPRQ